jgi:hypothetical protein
LSEEREEERRRGGMGGRGVGGEGEEEEEGEGRREDTYVSRVSTEREKEENRLSLLPPKAISHPPTSSRITSFKGPRRRTLEGTQFQKNGACLIRFESREKK